MTTDQPMTLMTAGGPTDPEDQMNNEKNKKEVSVPVTLKRPSTGSRLYLEVPLSKLDTFMEDYPGWVEDKKGLI